MTQPGIIRTAFFGGAFNPPHLGHRAACAWAMTCGRFDAVWVVPSHSHPYQKAMAPFDDRLALCQLQFADIPGVVISSVERASGLSYTYDVLSFLRAAHPDRRFTLLVGTDAYRDMRNWKESAALVREFPVLEIPRAGWIASPFPDVSSSNIRAGLSAGEDQKAVVGEAAMNYIRTHRLYEYSPRPHQL